MNAHKTPRKCHHCGTTDAELRPYGPGGSDVCFKCAFATPERRRQTEGAFGSLLDAAGELSPHGVIAIGTNEGPQPYDPTSDGPA